MNNIRIGYPVLVKPQEVKIAQLQPDMDLITLTGLVIMKQEKRVVSSHKNPLKPLHVFSMVLRDTEMDFINVTCWGGKEFIEELVNNIDTHSIIKITNPLVKLKNMDSDDETYRPWTPNNFCLTISESLTQVELVDDSQRPDLSELKIRPIRDHNDFYCIEDLILDEQNKINQEGNMLFCIRDIGAIQEIKTKNGTLRSKLDLTVFDKTKDYFKITIWDKELIKFASTWLVKQTVVFASDIKFYFNQYTRSLEASTTSKTIFIVNPDTNEGYSLYNHAKTVKFGELVPMMDQLKDKAIKTTIEGLKRSLSQATFQSEYVLLNACITDFDIDSDVSKLFSFKCKRCNLNVNFVNKKCPNQNCKAEAPGYSKTVDKSISLTDHTSSLTVVKMTVKVFETMIGMTIENFIMLDDEARTKIKWNFLFERKICLVKVTCQSSESENEAFLKYYFRLMQIDELNEQNSNQ